MFNTVVEYEDSVLQPEEAAFAKVVKQEGAWHEQWLKLTETSK